MRAAGERNFQSEGGRFKGIIALSLHYMVSTCKGRRLLVDNHIMCAVDVCSRWMRM